MRPIIEFCNTNRQHGTESLVNRLDANPEFDVLEYGCLGNCGECYSNPYALVNGIIVSGKDTQELSAHIDQAIATYLNSFDVDPFVELTPEPAPDPDPDPEPITESAPKTESETKPNSKPEPEPEPKTGSNS